MIRIRSWKWPLLATGLALASLAAGWAARAAMGGSDTWQTIPYRGRLELNGAVQDTPIDLNLSLWDAAIEGTKLWEETQLGVAVTSGEFAVELGATTPLNPAVGLARSLYLAIGVKQAGVGSFQALSGRQALGGVPFALAAKRGIPGEAFAADGLNVNGDTSVTGSVAASGAIRAASANVIGSARIEGDLHVVGNLTGRTPRWRSVGGVTLRPVGFASCANTNCMASGVCDAAAVGREINITSQSGTTTATWQGRAVTANDGRTLEYVGGCGCGGDYISIEQVEVYRCDYF